MRLMRRTRTARKRRSMRGYEMPEMRKSDAQRRLGTSPTDFKQEKIGGNMKIAVASDDGAKISSHFGMTKGFAIYDVDGKDVKNKSYLQNTFTGHAQGEGRNGGHGPHHGSHPRDKHARILAALGDCDVVVSHGMGMMIYNDLRGAGKQVFITRETDCDRAVQMYLNEELTDHPEMGCEH